MLREIRSRAPNFDMIRFLYDLRADVPVVIKAFLTGNVGTLQQHCTPDCVERLSGIIRAQEATVSMEAWPWSSSVATLAGTDNAMLDPTSGPQMTSIPGLMQRWKGPL